MSKKSRKVLKTYFQTGDQPTESEFVNWFDSSLILSGSNGITGSLIISGSTNDNADGSVPMLYVMGDITSSGNISASGTIYANNFHSTGGDVAGINFTDDIALTGNLTSSGDISASGTLFGSKLDITGSITNRVYTGEHKVGYNTVNASGLRITGSGLIIENLHNDVNIHPMLKLGDTELLQVNDSAINRSTFLIHNIGGFQITSGSDGNSNINDANNYVYIDDKELELNIQSGTPASMPIITANSSSKSVRLWNENYGKQDGQSSSFFSRTDLNYLAAPNFKSSHFNAADDNYIAAFIGNPRHNHSTDYQPMMSVKGSDAFRIFSGHVTASNVSASGGVYADGYFINNTPSLDASPAGQLRLGYNTVHTKIKLGRSLTTTQVEITGNITASGNISASLGKFVRAGTGSFGRLEGLSPISVGDPIIFLSSSEFSGNITSSGNISSSGNIQADSVIASSNVKTDTLQIGDSTPTTPSYNLHIKDASSVNAVFESTGNGNATLELKNNQTPDWAIRNKFSQGGLVFRANHRILHLNDDGTTTISGSLNVMGEVGQITASGTISSSATITANALNIKGGAGTEDFFLIRSSSFDAIKTNSEGVTVLGAFTFTPTARAGGFYYSDTDDEFYLGKSN